MTDARPSLEPIEGPDPTLEEPTMRGLAEGPMAPVRLKHPKGLWVLFITEMWERFSYYGMRALLVLYLIASTSEATKNPGFGWQEESAYTLYGFYTWAVYLTPIFGGLLADKLLGTHRSMLIGGWIIAAGHITLAATEMFGYTVGEAVTFQTGPGSLVAFMTGLFLIVIGTGFFKPCVSVMVGQLYEENDPRRDSGFTIFYMGINLGAFFSPLVAGTLGEKVGWHWGFGSAAVGMIAGLFFYQMFRPKYLDGIGLSPKAQAEWDAAHGKMHIDPETGREEKGNHPLTSVEWQRILVILILAFVGNIAFWTAFEQAGSSMNVFAKNSTDRTLWGMLAEEDKTLSLSIDSEPEPEEDDASGDGDSAPVAGSAFSLTFLDETTDDLVIGAISTGDLVAALGGLSMFEAADIDVQSADEEDVDALINPGDTITVTFPRTDDWKQQQLLIVSPPSGDVDGSGNVSIIPDEDEGFPATWYQSVNPLAIILFAPVFALIWVVLGRKNLEPSTPMKFAWGLWLLGLAFIAMVFGGMEARPGGLSAPHWLLITYVIYTWGELCLSPVGLSMVTKLAPLRLQSFMMGMWFFSFSLSNLFAGLVARLSVKLRDGDWTFVIDGIGGFYLALVIVPLAVGVFIMLISPILKRMMHGIH